MLANAVKVFSILFTAFALVPAGAHLMELANKIGVPADAYLTIQQIYRGWALAGILVVGALLSTFGLVLVLRRRRGFYSALVAFLSIVATQVIFWTFTFPMNTATHNWTMLPANWEAMRLQWEYSHAASALFNLVALTAATIAVVRSGAHPDAVEQS